jgi:hypothetical protein
MPTKYVLSTINQDHRDPKPTKMLTTKIIKLEKLHENKFKPHNNVGTKYWSKFLWSQYKILITNSNLEIMSNGFLKEKKHI